MVLKRNLVTILYSILFVGLMGIGFTVISCLALADQTDRTLVACFLVLGLMIYLLAAFFIKEKNIMQFIQEKNFLNIILETLLVLGAVGGLLFLNLSKNITCLILFILMLLCTYAVTRLLGGRLCGILGLLISFAVLAHMIDYPFVVEEYVNSLAFLIPYLFFLAVTKVLTNLFQKNTFVMFSAYIILAIVFTFAIFINPLVSILLVGCVLSLVFGTVPDSKGIFSSGPVSAGILFIFSIVFLAVSSYLMSDLFIIPEFSPDDTLLTYHSVSEIGSYLFEKYKVAVNGLYRPFHFGIFPAIITFMGTAAGYYSIRKKSSGIGPLCLCFVVLIAMFAMYEKMETQFYYMTYFLPVFAAYGFANTLLQENRHKIQKPEEVQETKQEQSVETNVVSEEKTEPETAVESVQQALSASELAAIQSTKEEEENVNKKIEEIPEWKVSDSFIKTLVDKESTTEEVQQEVKQEVQQEIQMDEIPPESDMSSVSELSVPIETPDDTAVVAEQEHRTKNHTDNMDVVNYSTISASLEDNGVLSGFAEDENTLSIKDVEDSETEEEEEETKLNDLLNRLDISDNIRRMNESAQEDIADVIEREEEHLELSAAIPAEDFEEPVETDTEEVLDTRDEPEDLNTLNLDSYVPEEFVVPEEPEQKELPKYEKPDFHIEPLEQPLTNSFSEISEYDTVPTINDLERKWRNISEQGVQTDILEDVQETPASPLNDEIAEDNEAVEEEYGQKETANGFAYSLEDVMGADLSSVSKSPDVADEEEPVQQILSEESAAAFVKETAPEHQVIHSEEIVKKNGLGKRFYHKITLD